MKRLVMVAALVFASSRAMPQEALTQAEQAIKPLLQHMNTIHTQTHDTPDVEGQRWVHLIKSVRRSVVTVHLDNSLGSGVFIKSSGLIVTNNHVAAPEPPQGRRFPTDNARRLRGPRVSMMSMGGLDAIVDIETADKQILKGKVVKLNPDLDLALIQLVGAKGNWPAPAIRDVSRKPIEAGEHAIAIGSPMGLTQTATLGIISYLGRQIQGYPVEDLIQFDAAVNPGNSGGALFDAYGKLIGINSVIISRGGGSDGLNFAIPIDHVLQMVEQYQSGR